MQHVAELESNRLEALAIQGKPAKSAALLEPLDTPYGAKLPYGPEGWTRESLAAFADIGTMSDCQRTDTQDGFNLDIRE